MKPRTPLKRSAFKPKVTWKKIQPISKNPRRKAKLFIPKEVREAVMERSEGQCEVFVSSPSHGMYSPSRCIIEATEMHHIKPKGRGGKNTTDNILHVCRYDHRLIHDNPKWAESVGLLIK